MNTELIINLNLTSDINEFISIVSTVDCDVDLVRDRYIIDAKSIMGIFSLDLSKPIKLVIHSNDMNIIEKFAKWRVN